MIEMDRDAKGRFAGEKVGPETRAEWAEKDRRANLAAQLMDKLGLPRDLAGLVKKGPRAGEGWWLGEASRGVLMGAAFGIAYASGRTTKDVAPVLIDLMDALGMREHFLNRVNKDA